MHAPYIEEKLVECFLEEHNTIKTS